MTKKKTVKSLKSKLDRIFSEYIRRRDADKNGYVQCCTCGLTFHWTDVDAGHLISRRHNTTRYHEKNCHSQCRPCNRGGCRSTAYYQYVVKRYGTEVLDELSKLEHQTKKWTTWELEELIEKYKKLLETK